MNRKQDEWMQNFQNIFQSTTLKLTAGYLAGIMALSLTFSFIVFNISVSELSERLTIINTRIQSDGFSFPATFSFEEVRAGALTEAEQNIISILIWINLGVFIVASLSSYLWARRTLEPIEKAHDAQSRFTSDASHELRTPLTTMRTEIEVALHDPDTTKEELKEILSSNLEEVIRLSSLTTTLLKIARLEDHEIDRKYHSIQKVVEDSIDARGEEEKPTIIAPKKNVIARINYESFTEMVIILLDNAYKYRTPGTEVKVKIWRRSNRVHVSVENEGPGIPAEDLPYVFNRFYRSRGVRSTHHNEGYGLGLSLAKKIVSLHRGEIVVTSTPGKTTSFTIKIPSIAYKQK